jgi:polyphosphate kinase
VIREPTQSTEDSFLNRELSWLSFARRVLHLVESPEVPLLERVRFAGILGMLHDEFAMKRLSDLEIQVRSGATKLSLDGRTPDEEIAACREELIRQRAVLAHLLRDELRPALAREGVPIVDFDDLPAAHRRHLRDYFRTSVQPILTPLAVDAEHPFPFISNLGLNLAVIVPDDGVDDRGEDEERFVRIKVPDNRPRWVPLPDGSLGAGWTPLEQVIAANLDLMFPDTPPTEVHLFRVTRGARGPSVAAELSEELAREPGSIVAQVSSELRARRFAGVVRLEVARGMPEPLLDWLSRQLEIQDRGVYVAEAPLGVSDLTSFRPDDRPDLRYPPHEPVTHPRLQGAGPMGPSPDELFDEIARGDILLHHPYHSFDTSVLRFLEAAAIDPGVLAIKVTIYRTSGDSPIVRALAEAVRRGKQVAVLVEITARFDEAPNIAWGKYLEQEGVHVSYGVERLKTHVKLAMVVREERGTIRRYLHFGTGNYHTGTARVYEDLGVLTADPEICEDATMVFNALTGALPFGHTRHMLLAPHEMRGRFVELIRREAEHAREGRSSGIAAKMNQLQDPEIIRELYDASRAGVPIELNVRGLCCLRPGVPGQSETIRVFGLVGRFLEHSRLFRFENDGEPEYFIGSADWMRRNLDDRVECVVPILDRDVQRELDAILEVYRRDDASIWDCRPDGTYALRRPDGDGAGNGAVTEDRAAQETFIRRAEARAVEAVTAPRDESAPASSNESGWAELVEVWDETGA